MGFLSEIFKMDVFLCISISTGADFCLMQFVILEVSMFDLCIVEYLILSFLGG